MNHKTPIMLLFQGREIPIDGTIWTKSVDSYEKWTNREQIYLPTTKYKLHTIEIYLTKSDVEKIVRNLGI